MMAGAGTDALAGQELQGKAYLAINPDFIQVRETIVVWLMTMRAECAPPS